MAYRITKEEYERIRDAEKKTHDKRISKKLMVLMLRYERKSNPEISEKLDISTDRISHLISEYKRVGLEEYIRVKYTGNHRNMSYEEEQAILDSFTIILVWRISKDGGAWKPTVHGIPKS